MKHLRPAGQPSATPSVLSTTANQYWAGQLTKTMPPNSCRRRLRKCILLTNRKARNIPPTNRKAGNIPPSNRKTRIFRQPIGMQGVFPPPIGKQGIFHQLIAFLYLFFILAFSSFSSLFLQLMKQTSVYETVYVVWTLWIFIQNMFVKTFPRCVTKRTDSH